MTDETSSISSGLPVFFLIRRPPALPHRLQCSTIGRSGLNRRVRDGNGCVPWAHRHRKICVTKVSAQTDLESCWKLASIRLFKFVCICDAVATEELCSEVHLRISSPNICVCIKDVWKNLFQTYMYAVFKVQYPGLNYLRPNGLKWTRTTDLTLIRRAL